MLPDAVRQLLACPGRPVRWPGLVEEIRLRAERPLHLVCSGADCFVSREGRPVAQPAQAYRVTGGDIARALQLLTQNSVYACEEELRQGFITLAGGHRVGLAGRAVLEGGRNRLLKPVTALNYRVARAVQGAADAVLPHIIGPSGVCSTLIASPPQAGKTTLLRDLVRQLSDGVPRLNWTGAKVGLVDERSEVAGSWQGIPRHDVGARTDVLDACPKAEGMMLMIRSLSPQVLAVDEIGRAEDAEALEEALHAGIAVIATAHSSSWQELRARPVLQKILAGGMFQRAVLLRRNSAGRIPAVFDLTDSPPRELPLIVPAGLKVPAEGGVAACGSS